MSLVNGIWTGSKFGRGSMTSHWCDFANSDVIMSIGSNNVENHPLSSRWVERAQDKGATWIVIDPRYSRSAAQADIYARIRPGTDLAFYGGLINYILQNELYHKDYVINYTNAACLLRPDFKFDVDHGLFSGWDPETRRYDNESWGYDVDKKRIWNTDPGSGFAWVKDPGTPEFKTPDLKVLKRDETLSDPNCVINVMKRHYARYTLENGGTRDWHGHGCHEKGLGGLCCDRASGQGRFDSLRTGTDPAHVWLAKLPSHVYRAAVAGQYRHCWWRY